MRLPINWRNRLCCSEISIAAISIGICVPLLMPVLPPTWCMIAAFCITFGMAAYRIEAQLAVFLAAGACWAVFQFNQHLLSPLPVELEGKDIQVTGRVLGSPSTTAGGIRFTMIVVNDNQEQTTDKLAGRRLLLSCYACPLDIGAGETWQFTVRLKRPHGYASWGAFDYEKYLFRQRISARGYIRLKAHNALLERQRHSIAEWREEISETIRRSGDGVGQQIILALTIGDKSGFTQQQRRIFQEAGVSHLLAISGLHVGLVFMVIVRLATILLWPVARLYGLIPRQFLVLMPALAGAFVYSALSGFAVSTQRALLMLLVFVVCRISGRDVSLLKVLLIAMALILCLDPFAAVDTGFWLSCTAVLIIALVSSDDQKLSLIRLQPRLWLGMMPASALFFGQISLVSPLVNLLAVPLFCLLLIPATLAGVCLEQLGMDAVGNWLLHNLAWVYGNIYLGLDRVTGFSWARWYTAPLQWWHWMIVGAALLSHLVFRRLLIPMLVLLCCAIFFYSESVPDDEQMRLTLLDVGQGLAIVIETADTVTVYDTGPKFRSGFTTAEAVLLPYLRSRGTRRIDTLIISHADNDHIGGYATVVDAFEVSRVLTSRPDRLPQAESCVQGQSWIANNTKFEVLSPSHTTPSGSNNRSCVLMVEHHGHRVLLSGDIEKKVERYLIQQFAQDRADLQADVLLVPHQGSKTSSTAKFIDAVQPKLALIAAGYRNHYGHPHPTVVERYHQRGIEILSTIEQGSIQLLFGPEGWTTSSYRVSEQRFWHYQKVSNPAG